MAACEGFYWYTGCKLPVQRRWGMAVAGCRFLVVGYGESAAWVGNSES